MVQDVVATGRILGGNGNRQDSSIKTNGNSNGDDESELKLISLLDCLSCVQV